VRFPVLPREGIQRTLAATIMSTKTLVILIAAVVVVLTVFGVLIWLANAPAVLSRSEKKNPLSGRPLQVTLNPLRDRSPERAADEMVRAMHEGRCREELATWFKDYRRQYATFICESEQQHPIVSWRLFDREEQPPLVILQYRAKRRQASDEYEEDLWVTSQLRDGAWVVTKYGAMY